MPGLQYIPANRFIQEKDITKKCLWGDGTQGNNLWVQVWLVFFLRFDLCSFLLQSFTALAALFCSVIRLFSITMIAQQNTVYSISFAFFHAGAMYSCKHMVHIQYSGILNPPTCYTLNLVTAFVCTVRVCCYCVYFFFYFVFWTGFSTSKLIRVGALPKEITRFPMP